LIENVDKFQFFESLLAIFSHFFMFLTYFLENSKDFRISGSRGEIIERSGKVRPEGGSRLEDSFRLMTSQE
jgi:hypothetical protein